MLTDGQGHVKIYKVKDTMRCNICDRKMTDKEIAYNEELGAFEPCSTCLEVIMDAAFSGGYQDTGDESVILVGEQSFGEGDDLGEVSFKDLTGHQRSLVYNMSDGDND